jgi:hypothetical protein
MKLFKYDWFIKKSNEDIHSICKKYEIKNYTINGDFVDVNGNVTLYRVLTELPIKFRNVSGYFSCYNNRLTSLEGSPNSVGGYFNCSYNNLTSLEGSPKSVGGYFDCSGNKLTSLEGSPISVGVVFHCYNNELTSLEGIPQMRSGGRILCSDNNLRDVRGIKSGWRGVLRIEKNPVYEIFKLFPRGRFDEVVEYLNEYAVIRDGDKIILQALEMVFVEMCLDVPQIEYIEGYEII